MVLSHPTGNANVRAVLAALDREHLLDTFCTTLAVQKGDWAARWMPASVRRQTERRGYEVQHAALARFPMREMARHAAHALRWAAPTTHETGWASVDAVCRDLDARTARLVRQQKDTIRGVYCYEDSARETFRAAQERGLTRFYELPIAYWETARRLLQEEAQRWPEWEPTLGGTRDSPAKLARKTEELALADAVIVPSRFVLDSLPADARAGKACSVAEFGSPVLSVPMDVADPDPARPLRVLFAGSLTQRKGLADLFAAMKLLGRSDVELIVMGALAAPLDFYKRQFPFRYEAPRSHPAVLALMRSCDVLALPSIVEGRALVQQEAMACGLPLIVTPHAGGEDLIDEGETGFLVPIRAPQSIAEKIGWLADHRDALPHMARCARAKAARYTWERYGEIVVDAVRAHAGIQTREPLQTREPVT